MAGGPVSHACRRGSGCTRGFNFFVLGDSFTRSGVDGTRGLGVGGLIRCAGRPREWSCGAVPPQERWHEGGWFLFFLWRLLRCRRGILSQARERQHPALRRGRRGSWVFAAARGGGESRNDGGLEGLFHMLYCTATATLTLSPKFVPPCGWSEFPPRRNADFPDPNYPSQTISARRSAVAGAVVKP